MSPEEIKQKREQLGLMQKHVAEALKISPSTLSRWESGSQIPQLAMDNYLRMFFDLPEVRKYLGIESENVAEVPEYLEVENATDKTGWFIPFSNKHTSVVFQDSADLDWAQQSPALPSLTPTPAESRMLPEGQAA